MTAENHAFTDDASFESTDEQWPSAPTQIVAVIGATTLSVVYFALTHPQVEATTNPLSWTPILAQLLAIVIVGGVSAAINPVIDSTRDFVHTNLSVGPKKAKAISVVGLFIVSGQCIYLLGYLTQDTGGTFYSPYVQPLLAMALLSPVTAKHKDTVLLVAVMVGATYAYFGDWDGSGPPPADIPIWIYFLTPLVALAIGLLNPLFGRTRTQPLVWRRSIRRSQPAGADRRGAEGA